MIKYMCIMLLLAGCSTYERRDVFVDTVQEASLINYKNQAAQLTVDFEDHTKFYSAGLLGLPIIPTYVRMSKPKAISLRVDLRLNAASDFSLGLKPCLKTVGRPDLCPGQLDIYVSGPGGFKGGSIRLYPPSLAGIDRVDRGYILNHFGAVAPVNQLNVYGIYKYRCEGYCPSTVNLDITDVVSIAGFDPGKARHTFVRRSRSRYTPIVQDF